VNNKKKDTNFSAIQNFVSLVYKNGNDWMPLPIWAKYFLELGATLSEYSVPGNNFVAAITVPTRGFAASLFCSGLILQRGILPTQCSEQHIEKIASLPIGTPVRFPSNNHQKDGLYNGEVSSCGKRYFRIQYEQGSEISIPVESAQKIEISGKDQIKLHKSQSGRELVPPSSLLKHLFDPPLLSRFVTESKLECVMLGQLNSLTQELMDHTIGYQIIEGRVAEGKILDLVRPKGTQYKTSNTSYRTLILPSSNKYNSQFTSKLNNFVTVFDNALSYIKWRSAFKNTNWVVILEKTDRNFDLALKEVNEDYYQNRIEKPSKIQLPNPPAGIELMFFEVRK
jgi:hypothetical protein